jgi:peptide/nickel transport system permease protein
MQQYLIRRLIQIIPLVIGISFISYLLVVAAPGDPIATMFSPDQVANIDKDLLREKLGLNQPIPVQYAKMMWQFLNGDLNSFAERRSTIDMVRERLPTTVILSFLALGLALVVGIPIAIISALRPYSILDDVSVTFSMMGLSLPQFWFALILILIFAERLRILPATGLRPIDASGYNLAEMFPYLIMPTVVLSMGILPAVVRYCRSSMMEVMRQDYISTARGKGLAERTVVIRHALKNALIPVVSLVGVVFPMLLGGAVVVETVFALPGLGRLAVRAALGRDYPVVLTINMLVCLIVLLSNLAADAAYSYLDPRIRQG